MAKDAKLSKKICQLAETLEIMEDRRLFTQILRAGVNLKEDVRLGKLHSFEEVFDDCHPSRRRHH